jgi:hypothetical protein
MTGGTQNDNQMGYMANGPNSSPSSPTGGGYASAIANALSSTGGGGKVPPWLQGLQAGQQIAALGQRPSGQVGMPMQRPMMGGAGMPGGMPQQGVVPGAQGANPMMPSQAPMSATGGMGMPQGMTPQQLQILMQLRQGQGGQGGLMR